MVHAHPLSSSCESIAIRTSSWRSRRSFAQFSILQTEFKYPEMPSLKDTLQSPSVVSYNLLISGNAGAGRTEKAGSKEFVVVVVGVGVVVVVGSVGPRHTNSDHTHTHTRTNKNTREMLK